MEILKSILRKLKTLYFLTKERNENILLVSIKMLYIFFIYVGKYSLQEIFYYSFYKLNKNIINTYFPQEEYYQIALKINKKEDRYLLQDKGITLSLLQDLIKREWLDLRKVGFEEFKKFLYGKSKIVVKKALGVGGAVVKVIEISEISIDTKELYSNLKKEKFNIIEEFLEQHKELAKIYPNSVNTLRIHTLKKNNEIMIILDSSIRFGSDNVKINSENGITVLLNENGKGITFGIYKDREFYSEHPETGYSFLGIKIPYWEEAIELVETAAQKFSTISFIGWDVAITPSGPEIIEGNFISGFIKTHQILYASINNQEGCSDKYKILIEK